MNKLFIILVGIVFSFSAQANNPEYYAAKVKAGDNLTTFLNRYQLEAHECNVALFCSLNKLKNKDHIIANKKYLLPVKLYTHNGKSIRSTIGKNDWDLAVRIEKYNKTITKLGIKPNSHNSQNTLWVPLEEFECQGKAEDKTNVGDNTGSTDTSASITVPVDDTPFTKKGIKEINVPLMGPKYENIIVEDNSLEGQVYYIISGHGGPDPGAMCTDCASDMCEDEYAYDVSLRLARDLMQHGATVHMIVQDANDGIRDDQYLKCDIDETLLGKHTIPLNQLKRLKERADAVNKLYKKYKKKGVKVQKAIEIHVDSRNKDKRQDVFFYYNKNSEESKKLATTVQEVFESKYAKHQKDRGYHGYVESRGLYMVRNLIPTTLFVELANIKNVEDHKRLIISSNRQALANWLFEGMRK